MKLTKDIISKISNKDRVAQAQLYKQCYGYMMSISLRYQQDHQEAEDVVNRAYLKLIKSIDKFDLTKNFKPWLSRITVNENIDACRKNKKLRGIINYDSENIDKDSYLSQYEYNRADEDLDAEQLKAMIHQLPSTTKQVFNLYVFDGYKHHEVAERLGITTGTSKWHLNSARKRLKVMIATMCETEKIIHYGE